jgi:hypothetical protein
MYRTSYSCQFLIKLDFYRQIFEKCSDIKFNENPSSGRVDVACGRTDTTKLEVAFHSFAKPPKNAKGSFECIC